MRTIEKSISSVTSFPISQLVEIVKEAEQRGFTKFYIPDEGMIFRDAFMALGLIAVNTSKIRLGTGITNPFIRHPGITAAATVTLDEISNGRAFLGISSGGTQPLKPIGIQPKKPMTAVREMILTSRALFRGEMVSYEGETLQYHSARLPFARPNIEIWMIGRGKNMLKLGGELADGVKVGYVHKGLLQDTYDKIMAGAAISGNKPKLCYFTAIITNEQAFQEECAHMSINIADSPPEVQEMLGVEPGEVEHLRQILNAKGMFEAGKHVKKEWVEPFVIMGSVEECRKELTDIMVKYHFDEFKLRLSQSKPAAEQMEELLDILPEQV